MNQRIYLLIAAILMFGWMGTAAGQSRDGAFSPDGTTVVYVSRVDDTYQIFTMSVDGSNKKQITRSKDSKYYPFFSPDGTRIVFMHIRGGKTMICTAKKNGSDLNCLTKEGEENADPDWSPDGSKIIFYSDVDGNNEIYMMKADGSDRKRLTHHPGSDQTASISPDGRKVVFVSTRDGNAEIYIMDIDGTNQTRITNDPRTDRVPRWSPDGKKIIWYSREPSVVAGSGAKSWDGAEIYEIELATLKRKQLTHNHTRDHGPVYSPDGKRIMFTSGRTGRREIFLKELETGTVKQLTGN